MSDRSDHTTRPFELAISTSLFFWGQYPWPAALIPNLKLIAEAGICWIELCYNGGPEHFDYTDRAATRRLQHALAKMGIRVWSGHIRHEYGTELFRIDHLDETWRSAAVAKAIAQIRHLQELGGSVAVIHPGGFPYEQRLEAERLARVRQSLDEIMLALGPNSNLSIALENLNRGEDFHPIATMKKLADSITLPSVGVCFDTSHAQLHGDIQAAVRTLGNRILTWHISDNDGQADLHEMPFTGTIDWPGFIQTVRNLNYCGPLVMELYKHRNPRDMLGQLVLLKEKLLCR